MAHDRWREALLTPAEMARADELAIAAGIDGFALMRRAGEAVAEIAASRHPASRTVAVLAGPGNNGGDAFVAARRLTELGRSVEIYATDNWVRPDGRTSLPEPTATSDAVKARTEWHGPIRPLTSFAADGFDLAIDGLFGAGLTRSLEGPLADAIERLNASAVPALSIDLPSGVSGLNGQVLGTAVEADETVTFFRRKPAHLLMPGRARCGSVVTVDIGIPDAVLEAIGPDRFANGPALWAHHLGAPKADGHKFDRGHAIAFSGGATRTGAARLAAMAALRSGAGLVTLLSPASALMVNAAHLTAVMLARCDDETGLAEILDDIRLNAAVLGPGFGIGDKARGFAFALLKAGRGLVLDADGLTSFKDEPAILFDAIRASGSRVVLTPHSGEFARLFPDLAADETLSKIDRASKATERSGAVVVLKGADTVIAAPGGPRAVNETGTPWLATAGSGDVLAGIITGLIARGVPAFEAAATGVWLHGKAAEHFGPGLIAEDLPNALPTVMARLLETRAERV